MRRTKVLLIAVCCFFFLGSGAALAASARDGSDIAPIDAGGLLQMIAKEKGRMVVVNVFASWCPPCREEVPGLVNVRKLYGKDKLTIIGVSVDKEPRALASFADELRINYPVRIAAGDFIEKVGVNAVPQLLIYNKSGDLVVNHRGLVDEEDLKKVLNEIIAE